MDSNDQRPSSSADVAASTVTELRLEAARACIRNGKHLLEVARSVMTASPRRNLIMGKRSLDRLAELRSPSAWIQWLKQQFDEADARSRELYERELRRVLPGRGEDQKRKWQVKVRLHTTSHSIRPKPLNSFNEGLEWFQLTQASKSEALLTYDLLDGVPIDRLWDVAMTVADFVVVSLQ
jgi:hypothetical protein